MHYAIKYAQNEWRIKRIKCEQYLSNVIKQLAKRMCVLLWTQTNSRSRPQVQNGRMLFVP